MLEQTIEVSAVQVIKKNQPRMYDLLITLIQRGQTPAQIDRFVAYRFGFRKGHVIRELVYRAACALAKGE